MGLDHMGSGDGSADACQNACCNSLTCVLWQFMPGQGGGCWTGTSFNYQCSPNTNWIGAGRDPTPTPEPTPGTPGARQYDDSQWEIVRVMVAQCG